MSITHALRQSCTRRRFTHATDTLGGQGRTATATTTYACRVDQQGAQAAADGPAGVDVTRWLILLEPTADVADGDELVVDGITYYVTGAPWPVQGRAATHHLQVTATRTKPTA